jgi:hypothetical protein
VRAEGHASSTSSSADAGRRGTATIVGPLDGNESSCSPSTISTPRARLARSSAPIKELHPPVM